MIQDTFNIEVEGKKVQYKAVRQCPSCKAANMYPPKYIGLTGNEQGSYYLYTLSECGACGKPFFALYPNFGMKDGTGRYLFRVPVFYYPKHEILTDFDERISALSPDFVETYHEAERAETHELARICGTGYRKSFEFLLKDYLKNICPDKIDYIEKNDIGRLFPLINNEDIRKAAYRAKEIGNDQAHYHPKYINKDIKDLKELITALADLILREIIINQPL